MDVGRCFIKGIEIGSRGKGETELWNEKTTEDGADGRNDDGLLRDLMR